MDDATENLSRKLESLNFRENIMGKNLSAFESVQFQKFCFEWAKRLDSDEKIRMYHEFSKWIKIFDRIIPPPEPAKSAAKAAKFRHKGNLAFRAENLSSALSLYTESVAVAPDGSEELAAAYADRSEVFFALRDHYECLIDINRALQENHPEDGKQKLKIRKDMCIDFLRTVIFSDVSEAPSKLGKLKCLKAMSDTFDPNSTDSPYHQMFPLPKVNFKNKMMKNASEKIKIKTMPENKVCVVATANIDPGEILVIEKPVAWHFAYIEKPAAWNMPKVEKRSQSHCANCLIKTQSLIHCPHCSLVMFCSARCRENAFAVFHRVECEIFRNLPSPEDESYLKTWRPVRALLVLTKQGEELNKIMNDPACQQPLSETFSHNLKEKFDSENVSTIFRCLNAASGKNWNDYSAKDEFELPTFRIAFFWLYLLKRSTFFGEQGRENQNLDAPLTNRELYVVKLLLRLAQANFYGIREGSSEVTDSDAGLLSGPVGCGLFPLVNLFTHSCDPNMKAFSYNNNLVCRAVRPIKNGEEITNCYLQPYYDCPQSERMTELREKFNVECICRPCRHDWPIKDMLLLDCRGVVFDKIGAKKFRKYFSRFQEIRGRFDDDELADAETFKFLCKYLSMLDQLFRKPCREFIECQILLISSMEITANFYP